MINIGNDEEKLREAYQDQFPDGTLRMRLREYSYFDKEEPVRIQWLYDDDAELFALIIDRYTVQILLSNSSNHSKSAPLHWVYV